jgi:hypothetical protein
MGCGSSSISIRSIEPHIFGIDVMRPVPKGCFGRTATDNSNDRVAGRRGEPSHPAGGDARMNPIRHPPAEVRGPPMRTGLPMRHGGACVGLPANDNRPCATRPTAGGLDLALIVAGRLVLGVSCIGIIAAGACLLGIDRQMP